MVNRNSVILLEDDDSSLLHDREELYREGTPSPTLSGSTLRDSGSEIDNTSKVTSSSIKKTNTTTTTKEGVRSRKGGNNDPSGKNSLLLHPDIVKIDIAESKKKNQRLYWADCARIYSMLAIIFLHCSGYSFERNLRRRNKSHWDVVCWYNCFTRFGVPMFVLLSGTFILDPSKNFTFKKLFRHNILRLVTAFFFWSALNALINIYIYGKNKPSDFFRLFIVGEEYLWFIFMIIGCYLIAPFLRLFSDDVVLTRYFLVLCVFFGSFLPTLKNIFNAYHMREAETELIAWTHRWHFHFTLEFVGYFVAGCHIVKHVNIKSKFIRILLYLLGIADVIFIGHMTTTIERRNKNRYSKDFRDTYTLTIAFYTVVLFIFFKHEIGRINFSAKAIQIISRLSNLTFGVYLSHMILKNMFSRYLHINQTEFFGFKYSPVIGCPIFWFILTVSSFSVSYLLSITPVLKHYVI